jgi:excinuclease UvrABC nuclease subunit
MASENKRVQELFKELCSQPFYAFPQHRKPLTAPSEPGVYIIRKRKTVLHVGRTLRARDGLHQRLKNHLHGSSSFTNEYLNGKGAMLREKACTYEYLEVQDPRLRALLEAYAVGILCPKHIGLGD